jgi:3-oxoacyl-[acyl-carrier-protein] synthase-3
MSLAEFHLSKPGVSVPPTRVDNAEILRRVRSFYRGPAAEWPSLESAVEHVFGLCRTQYRYLAASDDTNVGDYAVEAARDCLRVNDTSLDQVDLVICGGIARQYFEPATAMEVAAKLGLKRTHAFDVTSACVGHLEALQTAMAYLQMHERYRTALVCTSELSGPYLSYDIQTVRDLNAKAAGLTVGSGAACFLVRREAWPGGGIKLLCIDTCTAPEHFDLCKVPVLGTFTSSSVELMRLAKLIPPWLKERLAAIGWQPEDVNHFVFHQPSETMVRKILDDIGVSQDRGIYSHARFGNTASASVGMAFRHLLDERDVRVGDKFVLGSAAAGYSMVMTSGVWMGRSSTASSNSAPR